MTDTPQMSQDFDSPLPGETFKSVHEFGPWSPRQLKRMDYDHADRTEDERKCPREEEVTR